MSQIKVLKEYSEEKINPLSTRQLMSDLINLTPDGYDLPIHFFEGQRIDHDDGTYSLSFDITLDSPGIAVLIDKQNQAIATYLFAK